MWPPEDAEALYLLGRWIARWRIHVGVSQRTLAARAGISQGGLSRVERGLQACGSRRLARLIHALDQLSREGPMGAVDPPPIRPPSHSRVPSRAPSSVPDDLPPSDVDLRRATSTTGSAAEPGVPSSCRCQRPHETPAMR